MKQLAIFISIFFYLAFSPNTYSQQNIDRAKSEARFTIKNLGVNVQGKIRGLEGRAIFDPNKLSESRFEVRLPVKAIRTGIAMRDKHLTEEDFFHAAAHPYVIFQSHTVRRSETGYIAHGTIEIKGIRQEVEIPFRYEEGFFSGQFELGSQ